MDNNQVINKQSLVEQLRQLEVEYYSREVDTEPEYSDWVARRKEVEVRILSHCQKSGMVNVGDIWWLGEDLFMVKDIRPCTDGYGRWSASYAIHDKIHLENMTSDGTLILLQHQILERHLLFKSVFEN